jgi:hypothetical protein
MSGTDKLSNPAAFPHQTISLPIGMRQDYGMSLRDWFAGQLITSIGRFDVNAEVTAKGAYAIADAMLRERSTAA